MDANEFVDRLTAVAPGESFVYYTGDLAREAHAEQEYRRDGGEITLLQKTARRLSDEGRVLLTQRRRADLPHPAGGACFDYCATRRMPAQPSIGAQIARETLRAGRSVRSLQRYTGL